MTSEDLQKVLDAHDAEACIALFANANEAERRAVAKTAAARLKAVTSNSPRLSLRRLSRLSEEERRRLSSLPEEELRMLVSPVPMPHGGRRAAQVAVLATATLAELKKHGQRCFPPIDDAVAVLSTRRPPWVGDWAEEILSWRATEHLFDDTADRWRYVRRLVREGLCPRPRGARYIDGMIASVHASLPRGSIREALLKDPGLVDDEVWELFEVEPLPGMRVLLGVQPRGVPAEFRWEAVLAEFADEGRLSRTRLLDASLGALERDYHEAWARWFVAMHETLRPTLDERAERAGRYLGLVASHSPSTVTFALQALKALDEADRLERRALVDAIGPATLARAKGTVLSVLGLIDRAARRDPALRARASAVAVEALSHESPAVHEAVLDLIERHGERTDRSLADLLAARVDTVAASQRARLVSWLGHGAEPERPEETIFALDELLERASVFDPRLSERAGVTAAVEVLKQGGGEVPAVDFDEMEVPRLDPVRAIVPLTDLDELIELFSAVLEDPRNADDLERVLDGVSRLCDRVPDDFAARTGPLRARAEHLEPKQDLPNLVKPLFGLALGWITGRPHDVRYADLKGYLIGVFARRALAIARRAVERQAAPLLSAPTHLGGWIDPRVLVERVNWWTSLPYRPDRLDASIALLRLAPDPGPRAEALRSAAGLEGPYAAALRHALGGGGETVGPDPRVWVAAARARAPRDDDPLVEERHPTLGPDAGCAAQYSLRPGPYSFHNWWNCPKTPLIAREPALPPTFEHDLPTVLLHDTRCNKPPGELHWEATIWPLCRDSLLAAGAEWLLGYECTPSEAQSYRSDFEAILDPDVPLRPVARLLIAGTLSANTPELRGLATDALIAAVDDGRIDGKSLGEAIHRLLLEGLAKPVRLAKALGDAARVSPLHTRVVARALQPAVVGLSPPPRDLHVLLELLKELLVEIGEMLSAPGAEDYLHGLNVSGKTAKLVRDLLNLDRGSNPSSRSSAAACALQGRLERAERWMRIAHGD
jgi:hypothetical protein